MPFEGRVVAVRLIIKESLKPRESYRLCDLAALEINEAHVNRVALTTKLSAPIPPVSFVE
jgi:hypothetical protein